jgi:hypothetical protein
VFDDIEALLNERPEFVATSVPWAASGPLLVELASQNMPVLAETPPASDLEGLSQLRKTSWKFRGLLSQGLQRRGELVVSKSIRAGTLIRRRNRHRELSWFNGALSGNRELFL